MVLNYIIIKIRYNSYTECTEKCALSGNVLMTVINSARCHHCWQYGIGIASGSGSAERRNVRADSYSGKGVYGGSN